MNFRGNGRFRARQRLPNRTLSTKLVLCHNLTLELAVWAQAWAVKNVTLTYVLSGRDVSRCIPQPRWFRSRPACPGGASKWQLPSSHIRWTVRD